MSDAAGNILKKNWHLIGVMVALSILAGIKAFNSAPAESAQPVHAPSARAAAAKPVEPEPDPVAVDVAARKEEAMSAIRENEDKLAKATDTLEAAACLNGIGNLYYQRLEQYETAAGYYERVINEHKDAPCLYQSYVQLCLCYERMGNEPKRREVLRMMLDAFPDGSQERLYAYTQLYNENPPAPAPVEESPAEPETSAPPAEDPAPPASA